MGNVEGIDITSLEIRDTVHSTYTKYYVDPNDDGNHQEIYKPDPHAAGYVLPVEGADLATLSSKGEIYTSSGHKFFPPEGNVYKFDEGSGNPFGLPDGSYAVEKITDDQNDVTGLRFTEVELSGNDYVGKDSGHISEVGVHHDDELYQMKHYPINDFVWHPPGEVYDIQDGDISGIAAGLYARSESEEGTKLTPVVADETTTSYKLIAVSENSDTSDANDYVKANGAEYVLLTSDQLASFESAGLTAIGHMTPHHPNHYSELKDDNGDVIEASTQVILNNPWNSVGEKILIL